MRNPDFELVDTFLLRYEGKYIPTERSPVNWDDGSDIAALIAVRCFVEPMIFNGAWPAVYYNGIGWSVPAAARGYRLMGMTECAERCELAVRLVSEAERAHTPEERAAEDWLSGTLMQAIDEANWDLLDKDWYELTKDSWTRMACFIREQGIVVE